MVDFEVVEVAKVVVVVLVDVPPLQFTSSDPFSQSLTPSQRLFLQKNSSVRGFEPSSSQKSTLLEFVLAQPH